MAEVTLVVPCYNEADRLDGDKLLSFAKTDSGVRFILVNDGSTDRTPEILQRLAISNPDQFCLLHLPENVGKAEAVRRGLLAACEDRPGYLGYWDADLSTPLECLAEFRRILERQPAIQLVMGARVRLLGRSIRRSAMRHYAGRVFATAASLALRLPVYDTQCGAKIFRYSDLVEDVLRDPFISRWIFDIEIIARMSSLLRERGGTSTKLAIYELPLEKWEDVPGSKLRWYDVARASLELLVIKRRYF